jgi:hypothetical protein
VYWPLTITGAGEFVIQAAGESKFVLDCRVKLGKFVGQVRTTVPAERGSPTRCRSCPSLGGGAIAGFGASILLASDSSPGLVSCVHSPLSRVQDNIKGPEAEGHNQTFQARRKGGNGSVRIAFASLRVPINPQGAESCQKIEGCREECCGMAHLYSSLGRRPA